MVTSPVAAWLTAHLLAYLTVVFTVLSPLTALVFIAAHQGLWGIYMGCSFAPNHKGMPTLPPGHQLDYLRKQVLTTRNVYGRRWVDFVLGGLNYQIEHHTHVLHHLRAIGTPLRHERGRDDTA